MEPWIVVGWEAGKSEKNGRDYLRIYVEKNAGSSDPGVTCVGKECNRIFFYTEYVEYEPVLGDLIVTVDGRYGVDKVIKLGNVNG